MIRDWKSLSLCWLNYICYISGNFFLIWNSQHQISENELNQLMSDIVVTYSYCSLCSYIFHHLDDNWLPNETELIHLLNKNILITRKRKQRTFMFINETNFIINPHKATACIFLWSWTLLGTMAFVQPVELW